MLASLDDVSAVIENWIDWGQKIMKFAEIESTTRPVIKTLIRSLPESEDLFNPDGQVLLCTLCHHHFFNCRCQRHDLYGNPFKTNLSTRIKKGIFAVLH